MPVYRHRKFKIVMRVVKLYTNLAFIFMFAEIFRMKYELGAPARFVLFFALALFSHTPPLLAQSAYAIAEEHYENKSYEKAIDGFTVFLSTNPNHENSYYWRSKAYRNLENYEAALADATKAIELDTQDRHNFSLRGDIYYDIKNYRQAIADYTRSLNVEPSYLVFIDRGIANLKLRNFDKAIQDFENGNKLRKDTSSYYYWLGRTYEEMGRDERAKNTFRKGLQIHPNDKSLNAASNRLQ